MLLWSFTGLFDLSRAFLGNAQLFLTLPDSIGIVTSFLDEPGLLDIGDSTGTGTGLLDYTDTTGLTGTIAGDFDCMGFLYITGNRGNMHLFFDLKILQVRLTVQLYSTVALSRLW